MRTLLLLVTIITSGCGGTYTYAKSDLFDPAPLVVAVAKTTKCSRETTETTVKVDSFKTSGSKQLASQETHAEVVCYEE
jgi:uncharacterized protein YxeA